QTVSLPLTRAKLSLNIWDLGGQESFADVRTHYYQGAKACFLVFDLTDKNSFKNIKIWNEEKKKHVGDIITILLGNKNDLADKRVVSNEEIIKMINELNVSFFETSALTGANVQDAFNLIAYKLLEREAKKVELRIRAELKDEIDEFISSRDKPIHFALIRNREFFSPILQLFMELDPNPKTTTAGLVITYEFKFGITLHSVDVVREGIFGRLLEILKDVDGIIGVFDTRIMKNERDIFLLSKFLKLLYQNAKKPDFAGRYQQYMEKIDFRDEYWRAKHKEKILLFYKVEKNFLLTIMDNLKMFFTSLMLP
ncbi:MAG: Rab family GTPase, partial [Promethearchaeota archaeon]